MNSLKRSKLALTLSALVLIALAAAVPLASSTLYSYASAPSTSIDTLTSSLPPTWFQLAPTGPLPIPHANFGRAVGYDQTNNRLIFFGGDTTDGTLLNDTWVLVGADGTSAGPHWLQLNTVNTPAPRKAHAAAYDPANNILMVYGGCLGLCTPLDSNAYVLSNANGLGGTPTWTQLSTAGGPPPQRDGASAVYDPTSNSLIVFGGDNCCGTRYNDTWVLSNANGQGGTPTWTQLSPAGGPPAARVGHSASYDVTNNRMIIFGGSGCCSNFLNDTWVLSNANGQGGTPTWTQLSPIGSLPAVRGSHGAVFNPATDHMIVFAGSSTSLLNDIWILSHANGLGGRPMWKQVIPVSTSPSPRNSFVMVYRPSSKRTVIFGGGDATGSDFNETWVLMNIR